MFASELMPATATPMCSSSLCIFSDATAVSRSCYQTMHTNKKSQKEISDRLFARCQREKRRWKALYLGEDLLLSRENHSVLCPHPDRA
jgi:hypothetical protein